MGQNLSNPPERKNLCFTSSDVWDEIQYLVTALGSSLPGVSAIREVFIERDWDVIKVESIEDSRLVTLRAPRSWHGFHTMKNPQNLNRTLRLPGVDYSSVQVDLVIPDVHGCEVTVRENQVEVSVGPDVITRTTRDRQWRQKFLEEIGCFTSNAVSVCFTTSGHIVITDVAYTKTFHEMDRGLDIIDTLIKHLSPFKALLPRHPLSVKDRCLAKCKSRPGHNLSSADWNDCYTDVHIEFDNRMCAIIRKSTFLRNMQTVYPELQIAYNEYQAAVNLSGGHQDVNKATEHILNYAGNLSEHQFHLTDVQAMMIDQTDAETWFQQLLDSKGICCIWELTSSEAGQNEHGRSETKYLKIVTSTADPQSSIAAFEQTFNSCFRTSEVMLGNCEISSLQWEQFLDDLLNSSGYRIAPVLKLEQTNVTICDLASKLHLTREAVLDFLYRYVLDPQSEHEQMVTETTSELQPWQTKFLATAQVSEILPACLQHTMTVNSEMNTVIIRAPLQAFNKYAIMAEFWKYIASLSRKEIALSAASSQVLQTSGHKERIQNVLDEEGIVCDWDVEQDLLVISAHHSYVQQIINICMSETETAQHALQPQVRQQEDEQLQTEDHIRTLQQVSMNIEGIQNRGLATVNSQQTKADIESNHSPTQSMEEIPEGQADSTSTEITWRHYLSDEEGNCSNYSQSHQGMLQGRLQLSLTQTVHQPSHEVTAHSSQLLNSQSSNFSTGDFSDQPELVNASVADPSLTLLKSVFTSQENRTEDAGDSSMSPCHLPSEVRLTQLKDTQLMQLPSPLSDRPHPTTLLPSSVWRHGRRNNNGSPRVSETCDVEIPSQNSLVSSSSSQELEEVQEEASVTCAPEANSRAFCPESSARLQAVQSSRDPVPQQPGCPRRPHNTGSPAPHLLEDPSQSLVVSDACVPPVHVRAHSLPEQAQRNPDPQRHPRSSASGHHTMQQRHDEIVQVPDGIGHQPNDSESDILSICNLSESLSVSSRSSPLPFEQPRQQMRQQEMQQQQQHQQQQLLQQQQQQQHFQQLQQQQQQFQQQQQQQQHLQEQQQQHFQQQQQQQQQYFQQQQQQQQQQFQQQQQQQQQQFQQQQQHFQLQQQQQLQPFQQLLLLHHHHQLATTPTTMTAARNSATAATTTETTREEQQ